jgi:hypothetical protein
VFGAPTPPAAAGLAGQPPYGFVHLVHVADDRRPKVVSTIRMEVNDPANCPTTVSEQNAAFSLMYSSHYCTADDPVNTTAIACAWISSGVRVFDVRDPLHPREIAYYNPPANLDPESIRGGAPYFDALIGLRTKDSVSTQVRWIRDTRTGQQHLWFISGENGFQILRFTNGAYTPPVSADTAPSPVPAHHDTAAAPAAGDALPATGAPAILALLALLATTAGLMTASRRSHGNRRSA